MAESKSFTGARAVFNIQDENGNTQKVGFANGVSGDENIAYEPVEVLDNLAVEEHVPVGYNVSLNCQIFRTIVGTGRDVTSKLGSLKQRGIMPVYDDILFAGALTCFVVDRVKQFSVYKYTSCRAASTSFDITPRGVVGENVSFVAIKRQDESEI